MSPSLSIHTEHLALSRTANLTVPYTLSRLCRAKLHVQGYKNLLTSEHMLTSMEKDNKLIMHVPRLACFGAL